MPSRRALLRAAVAAVAAPAAGCLAGNDHGTDSTTTDHVALTNDRTESAVVSLLVSEADERLAGGRYRLPRQTAVYLKRGFEWGTDTIAAELEDDVADWQTWEWRPQSCAAAGEPTTAPGPRPSPSENTPSPSPWTCVHGRSPASPAAMAAAAPSSPPPNGTASATSPTRHRPRGDRASTARPAGPRTYPCRLSTPARRDGRRSPPTPPAHGASRIGIGLHRTPPQLGLTSSRIDGELEFNRSSLQVESRLNWSPPGVPIELNWR